MGRIVNRLIYEGFHHCEGCDYKSKHGKGILFFKGKYLCHNCRRKKGTSTCVFNINAKWSTIVSRTKGFVPGLRNIPRGKYKAREKKEEKVDTKEEIIKALDENNIVKTGLTKDEHKLLWHHFYNQGLSDEDIDKEIEKVREQIVEAHKKEVARKLGEEAKKPKRIVMPYEVGR